MSYEAGKCGYSELQRAKGLVDDLQAILAKHPNHQQSPNLLFQGSPTSVRHTGNSTYENAYVWNPTYYQPLGLRTRAAGLVSGRNVDKVLPPPGLRITQKKNGPPPSQRRSASVSGIPKRRPPSVVEVISPPQATVRESPEPDFEFGLTAFQKTLGSEFAMDFAPRKGKTPRTPAAVKQKPPVQDSSKSLSSRSRSSSQSWTRPKEKRKKQKHPENDTDALLASFMKRHSR